MHFADEQERLYHHFIYNFRPKIKNNEDIYRHQISWLYINQLGQVQFTDNDRM